MAVKTAPKPTGTRAGDVVVMDGVERKVARVGGRYVKPEMFPGEPVCDTNCGPRVKATEVVFTDGTTITVLPGTLTTVRQYARPAAVVNPCHRCGGTGQYLFHGTCFRCEGSGVEPKA